MSLLFDRSSQQRIRHAPYHAINHMAWPAGHSMDWHQHDYAQIIHTLSGELEVDWGNGWQSVAAHHCHFLPPGQKHRLRSVRGHRQLGINFSTKKDERKMLPALLQLHKKPCIIAIANPPVSDVFHEQERIQLSALDLFIARILHKQDVQDRDAIERDAILAVIDQHLQVASDVTHWAHLLQWSRATAQRRCKQLFQCGLAQLHEDRRMHACARDLIGSIKSIEELATDWGFADSTSFGRAFKRFFQKSPRQWREHARQHGA